ncbi:hypothetical protein J6590_004344 [Homalodisca vitripennis]|nr:hypothetical protein J6590_004344 [Homalodisca vitripennis]
MSYTTGMNQFRARALRYVINPRGVTDLEHAKTLAIHLLQGSVTITKKKRKLSKFVVGSIFSVPHGELSVTRLSSLTIEYLPIELVPVLIANRVRCPTFSKILFKSFHQPIALIYPVLTAIFQFLDHEHNIVLQCQLIHENFHHSFYCIVFKCEFVLGKFPKQALLDKIVLRPDYLHKGQFRPDGRLKPDICLLKVFLSADEIRQSRLSIPGHTLIDEVLLNMLFASGVPKFEQRYRYNVSGGGGDGLTSKHEMTGQ